MFWETFYLKFSCIWSFFTDTLFVFSKISWKGWGISVSVVVSPWLRILLHRKHRGNGALMVCFFFVNFGGQKCIENSVRLVWKWVYAQRISASGVGSEGGAGQSSVFCIHQNNSESILTHQKLTMHINKLFLCQSFSLFICKGKAGILGLNFCYTIVQYHPTRNENEYWGPKQLWSSFLMSSRPQTEFVIVADEYLPGF